MPRTSQRGQTLANNTIAQFAETAGKLFERAAEQAQDLQLQADPSYQRLVRERASECLDRRDWGLPVPLIVLGLSNCGRQLACALVNEVIASRQRLKEQRQLHIPVLAVSDGSGSRGPQDKMPYEFAVATGLSDASLRRDSQAMADGFSMAGSGHTDMRTLVDFAGQPRCVVADVNEDARPRLAILSGMLRAGQLGYYGLVVGSRPPKHLRMMRDAFGKRLLELPDHPERSAAAGSTADGAAAGGGAAATVLERLLDWYVEQPAIVEERSQAGAAQEAAFRPTSRTEQRARARAAAAGNACACGCAPGDAASHTAGMMTLAMSNPKNTVAKVAAGDHALAMAVGNILAQAVGEEGGWQVAQPLLEAGLAAAAFTALAAARAERNYFRLVACLLVVTNLALFQVEEGDALRDQLYSLGLADELLTARASADAHLRSLAGGAMERLRGLGAWHRRCAGCRTTEDQPDTFKLCSRCHSRAYCTKECQAADWKAGHKRLCPTLVAL